MILEIDMRTENNLPLLRSFCLISKEAAQQRLEEAKQPIERAEAMKTIYRRNAQLALIEKEMARREKLNSHARSVVSKVITKCAPDPRIERSGAVFVEKKKIVLRKPVKAGRM